MIAVINIIRSPPTCHIPPPSEIDLGLCVGCFRRLGREIPISQSWLKGQNTATAPSAGVRRAGASRGFDPTPGCKEISFHWKETSFNCKEISFT